MKTAIIGLGLIGGSMAIDLRKSGVAAPIIGVDNNPGHAARAMELGLVDAVMPLEQAIATDDLIFTDIPVNSF